MATVKSADDGSNVGKKPSKLLQINWWYGLDSWESEKKLHLHQMQSNSFFLSKFLLLAIVTYIVLLNWSHIFYSVRFDDSVYVNFFLSVPLTAFFCIFVTALHALIPPEMIVHDRFVQLMMYLMALWIVIAFNGIQSFLVRFELCSPMRMVADIDCSDGFYFPVELVVIELFLPVLIQHAFPNFGWVPLLAMYLVVFVLVLTFAVYSDAVESAPLLIVSTIYSLGSLFTLRSEALKSYQLSLDVEERRSIEQEATLGQRLRTMISGVAHDLKSVRSLFLTLITSSCFLLLITLTCVFVMDTAAVSVGVGIGERQAAVAASATTDETTAAAPESQGTSLSRGRASAKRSQ